MAAFIYSLLCLSLSAIVFAEGLGFSTYRQLTEDADNSWAISGEPLEHSSTIALVIQIRPDGNDHKSIMDDFLSLLGNYATQDVSVIPRVRYGYADGDVTTEPADSNIIRNDVTQFITGLSEAMNGGINTSIPVVQAGFLGLWGEWHGGPYCEMPGQASDPESLAMKQFIVEQLMSTGVKVAVRTPMDYVAVVGDGSNSQLTIHNDCVLSEGPHGSDAGTFVSGNGRSQRGWKQFAKQVAGGNTYGGEGCEMSYDWSNYDVVCSRGEDSLVKYINDNQISYLNLDYPPALAEMIQDPSRSECVDTINTALKDWS